MTMIFQEMQLCPDGVIRAVYSDEDGNMFYVINGERVPKGTK